MTMAVREILLTTAPPAGLTKAATPRPPAIPTKPRTNPNSWPRALELQVTGGPALAHRQMAPFHVLPMLHLIHHPLDDDLRQVGHDLLVFAEQFRRRKWSAEVLL